MSARASDTQRKTCTTPLFLITRLLEMQKQLCKFTVLCGETDYRTQFHPDLSPIGWHLGHTTFIENLWIRETLLKDNSKTDGLRELYLPQNTDTGTRGTQLPPLHTFVRDCMHAQRDNLALLNSPAANIKGHPLMEDDYLLKFLTQHHAMHLETMHMILTEKNLKKKQTACHSPQQRLEPADVRVQPVAFGGGEFEIGGDDNGCFDNELPRHRETLQDFALNATPASNAEFLGFMESGGYTNTAWWDEEGQPWLQTTAARAPHHWRRDEETGAWYGADSHGYYDLEADTPVHGLSHHEARAFARYAGARLPHENEWEAAHAQDPTHQRIRPNDHAWEWCDNTFHPYPGFKPFPYDEYSTPWFNHIYYSLRGHSRHTPDVLHRPTFRNFYPADKRHIFAGVRVAIV